MNKTVPSFGKLCAASRSLIACAFAMLWGAFPSTDAHAIPSLIATISLGTPTGNDVTVDPVSHKVYAGGGLTQVAVINAESLQITGTILVPAQARRSRVDPITGLLYSALDDGFLALIDGNTNSIVTSIQIGASAHEGIDIHEASRRAYISDLFVNTLSVVDLSTGSLVATIEGFNFPLGVDVDQIRNRVYVLNANGGTITVVDASTQTIVDTITIVEGLRGIAVNDATNTIYAVQFTGFGSIANLYVVDGDTHIVEAILPTAIGATPIAVNEVANRIYVGSQHGVTFLDGTTNTVVASVTTNAVTGLAIDRSLSRVYAAHSNGTISVIQDDNPDTDGDGVPDSTDNCHAAPNPDQTDTDLDGHGDVCDIDDDADGVVDVTDNCPSSVGAGSNQSDLDGDGAGNLCDADLDGDGVANANDLCPLQPDTFQTDTDSDELGDACDADDDNDAVCDIEQTVGGVCGGGPDNCALTPNTDQDDLDTDGIGDTCDADGDGDGVANENDNCALVANDQADADSDGLGDECDANDDNDSVFDESDNCPKVVNDSQLDSDRDGTGDACNDANDQDADDWNDSLDNCPAAANGSQLDSDGDGAGNVCDPDDDNDYVVDGSDLCTDSPQGAVVDPTSGCSLPQSCPCEGPRGSTEPWRNHGAYVSCVAHVTTTLANSGLLTATERMALTSAAAQSSCGKK